MNLLKKLNQFRNKIVKLEKKYKILTYSGLIFLTISNLNLRNQVLDLNRTVVRLEDNNLKLLSDMVYYNRSFEEFPFPVWQKVKRDNDFIMQYVNPAYVRVWLKPLNISRYEYMGLTDFDIYDEESAKGFWKRDMNLAINGGDRRFPESIIDHNTNKRINIDIVKWRVIERKDTLIYGMHIPRYKKPKR